MQIATVAVACVVLSGAAMSAHHSPAEPYDVSRRVTVSGTVIETRLMNPHAALSITVTVGGVAQRWDIELPGAFTLTPYWAATTLAAGDRVTVTGWPARDDSRRMFGRSVVTATRVELLPGAVNRDRYVEQYRRERDTGR